jgi:glycosyltransferase involved in cell wall biosynthesis
MDVPAAPASLPDDAGAQRIVCAGRIEPLKGQDTLAQAFALIAGRHPRAELWIIGPDRWPGRIPFRQRLQQLVPDSAIRARIHMPGLIPLQAIADFLRGARLAVVVSTGFESFSYSALEAMAFARPTIVTYTGALPELIEHEREGLIVSPGDPFELASAMDRYLEDRTLSERCGLAAHAAARGRYDTRQVLPQMLQAYEEAAEFYYRDRRRVQTRRDTELAGELVSAPPANSPPLACIP